MAGPPPKVLDGGERAFANNHEQMDAGNMVAQTVTGAILFFQGLRIARQDVDAKTGNRPLTPEQQAERRLWEINFERYLKGEPLLTMPEGPPPEPPKGGGGLRPEQTYPGKDMDGPYTNNVVDFARPGQDSGPEARAEMRFGFRGSEAARNSQQAAGGPEAGLSGNIVDLSSAPSRRLADLNARAAAPATGLPGISGSPVELATATQTAAGVAGRTASTVAPAMQGVAATATGGAATAASTVTQGVLKLTG